MADYDKDGELGSGDENSGNFEDGVNEILKENDGLRGQAMPLSAEQMMRLSAVLPESFWQEVSTSTLDLWMLNEDDIEEILKTANPGWNESLKPAQGRDAGEKKEEFDVSMEIFEWSQALVVSIVVMVVTFVLFIRIIGVDGISMLPTLHDGDKVMLSNLFYEPQNGDMIVFTKKGLRLPGHGDVDSPLVKRVIATEGQTIYIDFDTNSVYVDGLLLDEPYINEPTRERLDMRGEITVPEGYVFVMGDNRNRSMDSRDNEIGLVDKRYILGRVMARVFPFDSLKIMG